MTARIHYLFRFLVGCGLLVSAFFAPVWFTIIGGIFLMVGIKFYFEAPLAGLLVDSLYGAPLTIGVTIEHLFFFLLFVIFLIIEMVRPHIVQKRTTRH